MTSYAALEKSIRDNLDLVIIIANEGMRFTIIQHAKLLGISEKVKIITGLSNLELRNVIGVASMLVFPSLREGFGLPPLEAMACGTPVIASNIPALREVLAEAAILVDPKDIRQISEAIRSTYSDLQIRQYLIESGFKRCKEFSWEKTAMKTIEVYNWVYKKEISSKNL